MSLRINTNVLAMSTHSALAKANNSLSKSLERLASGLRITRSADDAAGLAISEKMKSGIRGLSQSSRNAQDGISLLQTADGALGETHSILQRMRELAVQAAGGTLNAGDRANIQAEIDQLTREVDRVAQSTEFNTKTLLRGLPGSTTVSGTTLTGGRAASSAVAATGSISLTSNLSAGSGGTSGAASTGAINLDAGNLTANAAGSGAVASTGAIDLNAGNLTAQAQPAIAASGAINLSGNLTAQVNATAATMDIHTNGLPQTVAGTTIVVAGKTYTLGDGTNGTVALGFSNVDNVKNLAAAITADGLVTAVADSFAWTTIHLTANTLGAAGNFTVQDPNNLLLAVDNQANGIDGVAGDTITVGSSTYTAGVDFAVGGTAAATASNLATFLSGKNGVTATASGSTVDLTAAAAGAAGNAIALAENSAKATVSGTHLTGGTDTVVGGGWTVARGTINLTGNLVAGDTITVGASTYTAGVEFAIGGTATLTAANLASWLSWKNGVTAVWTGGTTIDLTALATGSAGNAIALKTTSANAGISGSHLTGGVDGIAGDTVTVNGHTLTAGIDFTVGGSAAVTASNLASYIHANTATLGVDAAVDGSINTKVDLTANTAGTSGDSIDLAASKGAVTAMSGGADGTGAVAGDTVSVNGHTLTAGVEFAVGGNAAATAGNLANYIHANSASLGVDAAVNGTINSQVDITANSAGTAGDSISLATSKGSVTPMDGGVDATGATAADTVGINGHTLTAGVDFSVGANAAATAANLANYIHSHAATLGVDAAVDGSVNTRVNLTATVTGTAGNAYALGQIGGHVTLSGATLTGGAPAMTAAAASGALTINSIPQAGDTVTVDGTAYHFVASGADASQHEVNVGASEASTAANLAAALSGDANLTAVAGANVVTITATSPGAAGNSIGLASSSAASPVMDLTLQIGANADQGISIQLDSVDAGALGVGRDAGGNAVASGTDAAQGLDVSTDVAAGAAIATIDGAIQTVSVERSQIGAYQNRLEHAVSVLGITSENLSAAESQITDADMAYEMVAFSRAQILAQASIAMLAQVNQSPQMVLKLLM